MDSVASGVTSGWLADRGVDFFFESAMPETRLFQAVLQRRAKLYAGVGEWTVLQENRCGISMETEGRILLKPKKWRTH